MSDDWENSDSEDQATKATKAAPPPKKAANTKWEGEDEEEGSPASDWEDSSSEEEAAAPSKLVAPPKKKGTLKAKLAEKEAIKAAQKANGEDDDDVYDSDEVLDPREKARMDRERELQADLTNAADLLGSTALGGTSSKELDSLISFQLRTKEDFVAYSDQIVDLLIKKHENKPLFASFVELHARALAASLKDVEIRKVASGLTTLANEKQKEQREKASGKKKPKAVNKPGLGLNKPSSKLDTTAYEEALDDFGPDDFM